MSRRASLITLLLVSTLSAGCIENMGDLKAALGVVPPPLPEPVYEAPVAKAQANATTAVVGVPIRFLSEGTYDPQDLALALGWDFGDGARAEGPVALHAYDAPGDYLVKLRVVSAEGLSDEDALSVKVFPVDAAPSAAIRVLDAQGAPIARAAIGEPISFDGAASADREGALSFDWDFGDGATSHDARPTHAYAAPGAYVATLVVTDRAGQVAQTSARLAVDAAWRFEGAFEPMGDASVAHAIPLGRAATLVATLTFPAQAGLNDLQVVLRDAAGAEVARSEGASAPGAQGDATRALDVGLAGLAPGAWTIEVERFSGISVAYALDVRVIG